VKEVKKLTWRKASEQFCNADQPMCVEVAEMSDGKIASATASSRTPPSTPVRSSPLSCRRVAPASSTT